MTECEIFLKNLRNLMASHGCSQSDIANYLGISKSTVSNWFTRKNMPQARTLVKLAYKFGVSPSTLTKENQTLEYCITMNEEEKLLKDFRMLSPKGKEKALERMEELKQLYWYEKEEMLVNVL